MDREWVGNQGDGQGWAYGVPRMDQRVKVRIGNRKVIEMKQGSLEMRMGRGEVKVRVLVWGCTECNRLVSSSAIESTDITCHFQFGT